VERFIIVAIVILGCLAMVLWLEHRSAWRVIRALNSKYCGHCSSRLVVRNRSDLHSPAWMAPEAGVRPMKMIWGVQCLHCQKETWWVDEKDGIEQLGTDQTQSPKPAREMMIMSTRKSA
jgi:DNA-directed RNA polymerase subunit RPC12/RpoP